MGAKLKTKIMHCSSLKCVCVCSWAPFIEENCFFGWVLPPSGTTFRSQGRCWEFVEVSAVLGADHKLVWELIFELWSGFFFLGKVY